MSFKFVGGKLLDGRFEPEGIYLSAPFDGRAEVAQGWGEHSEFYGKWLYSGVRVKGHLGIDFMLEPGTRLLAVDVGRVVEISIERGGLERYVKLEHRWGESLYGHAGDVLVEAGQMVARGDPIAISALFVQTPQPFHFAIRIAPFNRHDGWGGFTDPQPFLPPDCLLLPEDSDEGAAPARRLHPMADEKPNMRRP